MKVIQLSVRGFDNNFSYLITNKNKAVLIDPTGNKQLIEDTIKTNNLELTLVLITHAHTDHKELLEYFVKKGVPTKTFEQLEKKPIFIISDIEIKTIFTPGHTKDSVCYLINNNLFTGDTLFVKGVGTTAYGGNKTELKKSLQLLASLNPNLIVWPGHDYGGNKSFLSEAINNSNLVPSKKTLDLIKKKVQEYEKNFE